MDSLDTERGYTDAPGVTLNAHPACDRETRQCFVQYPCPTDKNHISNEKVCIGEVEQREKEDGYVLHVEELSRLDLDRKKLVQHSHSPCVTPNYVVSKLDEFQPVNPKNDKGGLLKFLHQGEVNEWMVMDRRDNSSRILTSDKAFVNNHFWNCYENDDGINVQTVAVTSDYLDMYFRYNLPLSRVPDWDKSFMPAHECNVPFTGNRITCKVFTDEVFDYPTFNPYYKMNRDYQYFYAIGPHDKKSSTFFDRLIKFDGKSGEVLREWHEDGIFLTEASFFPRGNEENLEDDGVLFTIAYNSSENLSYGYLFEASSLTLVDSYALGIMIPFHAHGVTCSGKTCFSNP
jgi:carotenoid cleavage dioxygenase-like enzyme